MRATTSLALLASWLLFLPAGVAATDAERQSAAERNDSDAKPYKPAGKSWKELRDENVVIQKDKFTCGAAALCTLIRHYLGEQASEKEILDIINKHSPEEAEKRKQNGLTMRDLKKAAESMGYEVRSYQLNIQGLKQLDAPLLVRIICEGEEHFVVLRGIVGDRAVLADPVRGNVRVSVEKFLEEWNGTPVLVLSKPGVPKPTKYPLALDHDDFAHPEVDSARRATLK